MSRKFLCVLLVFVFTGSAWATSLWNDDTNWFGDGRPSRVGDIVTVRVEEQTDASDEADMTVRKNSTNTVGDNGAGGTGILSFIRGLALTTDSQAGGNGTVERTHSATTTLACLVTEVLPNGNLVIEGTRDVRTSDEVLQIQLTGVIRPRDVNSDNQISSRLVANAEIAVKGRGILSRTQNVGIISRILQAVF